MEKVLVVMAHPFTWGLGLGLVFAVWAFSAGWAGKRALRREVRELQNATRTNTKLAAMDTEEKQKELAELEEKNKNLEITVRELKNEPDRAELQKLYVLDRAAELMTERVPGFAAFWQVALKEAQEEMDKTSNGNLPWTRRIVLHWFGREGNARSLPPKGESADREGK